MKSIRLLSVVCLSLVLTSLSCVALAVPSITIASPSAAIVGGATFELTVTASEPGFMTLVLSDASGAEVATLCSFEELHTQENAVALIAVDDNGDPLAAGQYTLTGTAQDPYGAVSSPATASLSISARTDVWDEEEAIDVDEGIDEEEDIDDGDIADDEAPQEAPQTQIQKPVQTPSSSGNSTAAGSGMNYTSGSVTIGEEGYQIGVGVSDVAQQDNAGYWSLTSAASDAEIWAAIVSPFVGVDVGENESSYIYDSVAEGRNRLGTVSGISQGLNVITRRDDGWSLVEAYRNEDGAFVRGYIRTNRLREAAPNTDYGIVIDKATQTLIVFMNGERIGSCEISTGLPTAKYLHRETPAGEFITVTRRGTTEYYGNGFSKYTIRINGNYHLAEIPTTKKNGSDFSLLESSLGQKATRGNICIAHDASSDGGINAEWLWNLTDKNKRIRVLIFDDKDRSEVPVGE